MLHQTRYTNILQHPVSVTLSRGLLGPKPWFWAARLKIFRASEAQPKPEL